MTTIHDMLLEGVTDFTDVVEVHIHRSTGDEYAEVDQFPIKFRVDVTYEDWGINGIDVFVDGVVNIPYVLSRYEPNADTDVEEDAEVSVDLGQLKHDITYNGGIVGIGQLDLYLSEDGGVDYSKSTIEIYTPSARH